MSLVIDDPAIEALARELARRDGVSPAEAIARALADSLNADPRAAAVARLSALRAHLEQERSAWPAWEDMKSWAEDGRG